MSFRLNHARNSDQNEHLALLCLSLVFPSFASVKTMLCARALPFAFSPFVRVGCRMKNAEYFGGNPRLFKNDQVRESAARSSATSGWKRSGSAIDPPPKFSAIYRNGRIGFQFVAAALGLVSLTRLQNHVRGRRIDTLSIVLYYMSTQRTERQ